MLLNLIAILSITILGAFMLQSIVFVVIAAAVAVGFAFVLLHVSQRHIFIAPLLLATFLASKYLYNSIGFSQWKIWVAFVVVITAIGLVALFNNRREFLGHLGTYIAAVATVFVLLGVGFFIINYGEGVVIFDEIYASKIYQYNKETNEVEAEISDGSLWLKNGLHADQQENGTYTFEVEDEKVVIDGDVEITGDQFIDGNQTVTGNQTVDGDQTITGNQTVDGDQTVTGNQTVVGDSYVEGNLTVDGDADINGDLNVDGDVTVGGCIDTECEATSTATPTAAATATPTAVATAAPTAAPTVAPTAAPTVAPTAAPTAAPAKATASVNWAEHVDGATVMMATVTVSGDSSVNITSNFGVAVRQLSTSTYYVEITLPEGSGMAALSVSGDNLDTVESSKGF